MGARARALGLLALVATGNQEVGPGVDPSRCLNDALEPTSLLQRPRPLSLSAGAVADIMEKKRSDASALAGKSCYFIPVDRFANPSNSSPCDNDNVWCGGTIAGITAHLDYIQGMGFDCIWITPVVQQYDGPATASGTGCMGYWAYDLYKIDPHFGTPADLKELVHQLHNRGMSIMYDFVANHMGPIRGESSLKRMNPFNSTKHFHQLFRGNLTFDEYTAKSADWPPPAQAMWSQSGAQCTQGVPCNCYACSVPISGLGGKCSSEMVFESTVCPPRALSPYCMPGDYACEGYNETITQEGWFYDLGDLNQSDPFVHDEQLKWIRWFVNEYNIDLLRLDTAAFMSFDFLSDLQAAAGVPIIGEVTTTNLTYHAQFQANPPVPGGRLVLDAVLNFPIYYTALAGFCGEWFPFSTYNLTFLGDRLKQQLNTPYANLDTLGNFIDNHDVQRVTSVCQGDVSRIANVLTFVMLLRGVPIIYYGTESLLTSQRESLWGPGYRSDTPLYKHITSLNSLRKETGIATETEELHETGNASLLVFTRGGPQGVWVFLNNLPQGDQVLQYPVAPPPAPAGHSWVDALSGTTATFADGTYAVGSTAPRVLVLRQGDAVEPV